MVRRSLQSYLHSFVKRFSPELSNNHACSRFTLMYLPRSPCYILALRFLFSTKRARVQQTEATCLSFPAIDVSFTKLIAVASRASCTGKFDEWRFSRTSLFRSGQRKGFFVDCRGKVFQILSSFTSFESNTHLNPGYIFASCKLTITSPPSLYIPTP